MIAHIKPLAILCVLTIFSGLADAQGFIHAGQIWSGRRLVPLELLRSAAGFGVGITLYWVVIRYLREYAIVAPELQALAWFGVTMVSVALLSGHYAQWRLSEQVVGAAVLLGIGWLLVRTAA